MTGSRPATGTTRVTTRSQTARAPTPAARGRSTQRPVPGPRSRRWTRSTASCRRSNRPSCGGRLTTTSTTSTTSQACLAPPTAATRSAPARPRPRDHRTLRRMVEPGSVRSGGPVAELRDPARGVRGLHRSLAPRQGALHRDRVLAAQQGVADAVVGPLQQRLRPGRQLFRRSGGQPAAARHLRLRLGHGVGGQPHGRRRGRALGAEPGLFGGGQAPGRPHRLRDRARRRGRARGRPAPDRPGIDPAPASRQAYFVQLLLRRGGEIIDRNVYWLSTQPDVINWAKTIGSPRRR